MKNKSEMINRIAELEEENAKLNAIIDSYQPRLQKYKDILKEIKEIAEADVHTVGDEKLYYDSIFDLLKEILEDNQ